MEQRIVQLVSNSCKYELGLLRSALYREQKRLPQVLSLFYKPLQLCTHRRLTYCVISVDLVRLLMQVITCTADPLIQNMHGSPQHLYS